NLLVRTVGVVLALPFLPAITRALELAEPAPGRLVVNFHLAFNLALAALFLGSVRGLAHLLTRWLPDPPAPTDPGRPVYLHVAAIVANSLVEFAVRSVKRGRALTVEELETVAAMHGELLDSLRLALAVYLQAEPRDAKRLAARKGQFREFEASATALSVRLL